MIRKFYRKYQDKFDRSEDNFLHFLYWMCAGLAIGGVVGLVGIAFHLMLEWATEFRVEHPMILWLLPLGGIAIVLLIAGQIWKKIGGRTLSLWRFVLMNR